MFEMFVSTDARRACSHGVIGSTMGAHPRGTGSNSVEGSGHKFFPSCCTCQLYLSSFFDTHIHTHTAHTHAHRSTNTKILTCVDLVDCF